MILPTANGVAKPQTTSQSKAKMDKTQVGADNIPSHWPHFRPSDKVCTLTSCCLCSDAARLTRLFFVVVLNRFHPPAVRLLQWTLVSRFPPVNSPWRTSSSLHQQTSTGSSLTRRCASVVSVFLHKTPYLSEMVNTASGHQVTVELDQ